MDPRSLLVAAHVLSNLVWIGSILSVAIVASSSVGAPRERGTLARLLYRRLAAPAFGLSFVFGAMRLVLNHEHYLKDTKFMHAKLTLALVVIVLHHVIAGRVKRLEAGTAPDAGPVGALGAVLLVLAGVVTLLAVLKLF